MFLLMLQEIFGQMASKQLIYSLCYGKKLHSYQASILSSHMICTLVMVTFVGQVASAWLTASLCLLGCLVLVGKALSFICELFSFFVNRLHSAAAYCAQWMAIKCILEV